MRLRSRLKSPICPVQPRPFRRVSSVVDQTKVFCFTLFPPLFLRSDSSSSSCASDVFRTFTHVDFSPRSHRENRQLNFHPGNVWKEPPFSARTILKAFRGRREAFKASKVLGAGACAGSQVLRLRTQDISVCGQAGQYF